MSIDLNIWLEKVPGHGEDAEPLLLSDENSWVAGVYDGLGGAGSKDFVHRRRGLNISGAALAARTARRTSEQVFTSSRASAYLNGDKEEARSVYSERLSRALKGAYAGYYSAPSRIRGRLLKKLPTTVATLHARTDETGQHLICRAFWAGDSRAYLLTPGTGLQQLSADSLLVPGNAWENLTGDSPMSNVADADGNVNLTLNQVTCALPAAILAATDGCFAYLPSPPYFEYLLLHTLTTSSDAVAWKEALEDQVSTIAGDDASLALIGIGWKDFSEMKDQFRVRFSILEDQLASISPRIENLFHLSEEQRFSWWEIYRAPYEALLDLADAGSRQ